MGFTGIYSGNVADNADGLKRGRLKVSVPAVFGPTGSGTISVADLPWAIPAGLPSGQTTDSGGIMWLPDLGDRVLVMFLDGEPEKPVWFWGMSDLTSQDLVNQYASSTTNTSPNTSTPGGSTTAATIAGGGVDAPLPSGSTTAGAPQDEAILSRYGNQIQFSPIGIVQSTKNGYGIVFTDSATRSGSVTVYTPLGGLFDISDNSIPPSPGSTLTIQMQNMYVNIFQNWTNYAQFFDFIASRSAVGTSGPPTSAIDSSPSQQGITTSQAQSLATATPPGFGIQADRIILGYRSAPAGASPTYFSPVTGNTLAGQRGAAPQLDPIVRVSDMDQYTLVLTNWLDQQLTAKLTAYFQQWQTNFEAHFHTNGNMGAPTGPPVFPPPNWVTPLPNSTQYMTSQRVPTGSPIVFATKQTQA